MKHTTTIALLFAALASTLPLRAADLSSPDGRITVSLKVDERGVPWYSTAYRDEVVVPDSRLGMRFRGARGQEYNAWGEPPNPPEHTAILPYTRMLSGPMDFTPGIFDLTFKGPDSPNRVQTTLAKSLSLYVVLYSPIQIAADLPENYAMHPDAFRFIVDVPTDWERSVAVAGEVGDYVVIARQERGGDNWYLGALTNEEVRRLSIPLSFLDANRSYDARIYRDGDDAHWRTAPTTLQSRHARCRAVTYWSWHSRPAAAPQSVSKPAEREGGDRA